MSATIHFQCSFDLERVHPVSEGWDDLMDEILLWIKVRTPPLQAITFEEFSQGGRWNENRHIVETVYDRGDSEHGAPRLWAMRFSRPDLNHWQRIWSTDFGISSSSSGKFHLSVTIGHSLAQEYIGSVPPPPAPTAPRIIRDLISSADWIARAGSLAFEAVCHQVDIDGCTVLRDQIGDSERRAPLIVYGCGAGFNDEMRSSNIARLVVGTAAVYQLQDLDAQQEFQRLVPALFECSYDMIRIYQPSVNFQSKYDSNRHRFFKQSKIEDLGEKDVLDMLVQGIARRPIVLQEGEVGTLRDVFNRQRAAKIQKAKERARAGDSRELLKLYEDENVALEDEIRTMKNRLSGTEEAFFEREVELEEGRSTIAQLTREKEEGWKQVDRLQRTSREREEALESLRAKTLPKNVLDVVERIGSIFSGNIVFTERAKKSAAISRFDDPAEAYNCLAEMATTLRQLYFDENMAPGQIAENFHNLTGFELAVSEGSMTKNDPHLSALRRDEFEGRAIDIGPHVKIGNRDPKLLRIHYHADPTTSRIIVGHCGGHLESAGSRFR